MMMCIPSFLCFFPSQVRSGEVVSNDEILSLARLFDDELMLSNLSKRELVLMCEFMGISSVGIDATLRWMLARKIEEIRK